MNVLYILYTNLYRLLVMFNIHLLYIYNIIAVYYRSFFCPVCTALSALGEDRGGLI